VRLKTSNATPSSHLMGGFHLLQDVNEFDLRDLH